MPQRKLEKKMPEYVSLSCNVFFFSFNTLTEPIPQIYAKALKYNLVQDYSTAEAKDLEPQIQQCEVLTAKATAAYLDTAAVDMATGKLNSCLFGLAQTTTYRLTDLQTE